MKIVTLAEFIKMPEGTVFSKFEPHFFDQLMIKGESIDNGEGATPDFFSTPLTTQIEVDDTDEWDERLNPVEMDFEAEGRDACFHESQLFAVWDQKDVTGLISKLQKSLGVQC